MLERMGKRKWWGTRGGIAIMLERDRKREVIFWGERVRSWSGARGAERVLAAGEGGVDASLESERFPCESGCMQLYFVGKGNKV